MNEQAQEPGLLPEAETEVLTLLEADVAMHATERAQLDVQISTAKAYPRSIQNARNEALELATLDEVVAKSCFYLLPRGGKKIEGPSTRLAEIIANSWTNLRVKGDITSIDKQFVTATGTCMDLERNVGFQCSVKRRITDKYGRRFTEDMIVVTCNAAIAIATRNAIFKVVPRALWESIYQKARLASIGKEGTIKDKRANALKQFEERGATKAQVFKLLDVKGAADIGVDELVELHGILTALEEGDTTMDQLLNPTTSEPSAGSDSLNQEIKRGDANKNQAAE